MKTIIITSTVLIVLLAVGAVGFNNNNINNGIDNAFAQMNDRGMIMSNQSGGMKMMNLNGTIDVEKTMAEAFKAKVTTDIIGAIQTAQASVGANSFVKKAELTFAHGYLVYKIMVVDENMKKYKVIVDPGNGQVLIKKEMTLYDEYKMKYGEDEEKYNKYGHYDDDDDQKKMMMTMMNDKEY